MSRLNIPMLSTLASLALSGLEAPRRSADWQRPMKQRLHDTKPFESTADARRRKKEERQAKKKGRRSNR